MAARPGKRTFLMPLICVMLAPFFALSCQDDIRDGEDSFSVEGLDEVVTFVSSAPEVRTFVVDATASWTISIKDLDWLSVSRLKGKAGRYEISLRAMDNVRGERSGEMTVSAGGWSRTVSVVQLAGDMTPSLSASARSHRFESVGPEAYAFVVNSNVDWTIVAEDMPWLSVSPLSGKHDRQATVTLRASDNTGAERSGKLLLRAEGLQDVAVEIAQDKFKPSLNVTGATDNAIAFSPSGANASIQVVTNAPWSISLSGLDWLTVTPMSGDGDASLEPQTVSLTADANDEVYREGTLTVSSSDSDIPPVVITVSQDQYASVSDLLLAQWTMTDDHVRSTSVGGKGDNFALPLKADLPEDCGAEATWYNVNGKTPAYMVRGEGNYWATKLSKTTNMKQGHYLIKPVWTGDYMEFVIPGVTFPAGARVTIRFGANAQAGPVLYYVKYWDDGQWKLTSRQMYTSSASSYAPVPTTIIIPYTAKTIHNFEETAVYSKGIKDGEVKFRIECADGRFQSTANSEEAIHTSLNASGILRLAPWNFDEKAGNVGITFHLSY